MAMWVIVDWLTFISAVKPYWQEGKVHRGGYGKCKLAFQYLGDRYVSASEHKKLVIFFLTLIGINSLLPSARFIRGQWWNDWEIMGAKSRTPGNSQDFMSICWSKVSQCIHLRKQRNFSSLVERKFFPQAWKIYFIGQLNGIISNPM